MPFLRCLQTYRFPILLTLALRVGYSLWSALIWRLVDPAFPLNATALWETYYHLPRSATLAGRALLDVWLRWDAVHYMNIAAFGYGGVGAGDTVFFPLYPYLVGGLARLTGLNVTLVGLLVSTLATLLLLICLQELVLTLFGDAALARDAVLLLALYPTAFFLHAPFTDALFLACVVASVWMMARGRWLLAGMLACAAGLARPQGVLLLLPLAVLLAQDTWRQKLRFPRWQGIAALLVAPVGFGLYSLWRASTGLSSMLHSLQLHSNVRFQNPLTTLFRAAQRIVTAPRLIEVSELLSVLVFLGILIWMAAQPRFRAHPALLLYAAATWLLITSKTTIDGSPLQSANRYVLHIFFAFVGLAALLQHHPALRRIVLLAFPALGLICATLSALWVFVG